MQQLSVRPLCLQIPSSWRSLIEDPSTLQLFLDYYNSTSLPGSAVALDCLVRLASVRRSLFSSESERSKFLNRLVNGTRDILRNHAGLQHHENYHQACRLLGRLKTNYQLAELVGARAWAGDLYDEHPTPGWGLQWKTQCIS
jgi:exportin-7